GPAQPGPQRTAADRLARFPARRQRICLAAYRSSRLSDYMIIFFQDNLVRRSKGVCAMEARNAIVTGASRGLGVYIARALAAKGMNLLLVARSHSDLARVAAELRARETKVVVAAVDLAEADAPHRIAEVAGRELGTV